MKILFVNTNDTQGGAARAAYRIMRGMQSLDIHASMLVKYKSSSDESIVALEQFVPQRKIHVLFDWCAMKIKNKWQHLKWYPYKRTRSPLFLSDLRSTRIYNALQKEDFDILHIHWINERFLDIRELSAVKKPILWTLHDSWPFTGICHVPYDCENYETHCRKCPMLGSIKEKDLAYEVFSKKRKAYEGLDLHIVTPSRWLAECARQSVLLGNFPISVIPNCLDTELFSPQEKNHAREFLGLDLKKTYILYGAMQATKDPNKGFEELRNALELIKGDLFNVELLVFGSNDSYDSMKIPLLGRTIGYVTDDKKMAALYNAADVTVVPSRSENLSNTIMESLSCSTPVCCFDIGGNSDMVEHKKNGYLAKEKFPQDLAAGIVWCIENNQDKALGIAARKKVLANYTIGKVSEQYARLYQSLLK